MSKPYQSFMDQIEAARRDVDKIPAWLKESAKVAALTYPASKAITPPLQSRVKKHG